ncbi:hypothetical protein [Streptosporangium sp. NPDC000509]|uniref:hypothetical protein n=1 Tax=Streptosporangium sp. NPDC000509 TaxID=3366186 RepID=UPI003687D9D4
MYAKKITEHTIHPMAAFLHSRFPVAAIPINIQATGSAHTTIYLPEEIPKIKTEIKLQMI